MQLKNLFKNTGAHLDPKFNSIEINKIQYDSRKVEIGDLFIAVKGFESDGHDYLEQVAKNGAAAAVVRQKDKQLKLPQVVVKDSRKMMGLLAYNYYAKYLDKIDLIGITGTNGKTTCSYLIRSVLEAGGISCGLAGTIEYIIGTKKINAWNTTPEAVDLYKMLAEMQQTGNKACVLEVSSHALALNRVAGLKFKTAIFTNLSRDHMDFHKDMDTYFQDKNKLFSQLAKDGFVITNVDDPYGAKIIGPHRITTGTSNKADVYATDWKISRNGTELNIQLPEKKMQINSALVGDFNVYNQLTAVAAGLAMNISAEKIKQGLEQQKTVPGRLESYPLKNGALAVIDYAHTPDALEKALTTIRKITDNILIVVFGCGGDRDKGKRPLMGKVAQNLADHIIVTDDNPRTENSQKIIEDIVAGIEKKHKTEVIADRRQAIKHAIKKSKPGDVVLIAGKGHESYQIIGKVKHNFDEAAIIREADHA
jgi:UDP-N-acetylmuramoyl-L-alanyl-D-glutamate--2,6-diaminopimelate ligase